MPEDRSREVRVGLLVLAALALLVAFLLALGDFSLRRGHRIYLDLDAVAEVKPGAPVKVAGYRVGRVRHIRFLCGDGAGPGAGGGAQDGRSPACVRFTLEIESEHARAIRVDTVARVASQGLLGERYIEMEPGSKGAPPLPEGGVLRGLDTPRPERLLARVGEVLDAAAGALEANPEVAASLLRHGDSILRRLDTLLATGAGSLERTAQNLEAASREAVSLLSALRNAVGDGDGLRATLEGVGDLTGSLRRTVPPLVEQAGQAASRLAEVGEVAATFGRNETPRLRVILEHLVATARTAELAAADLRAVAAQLRAGEGAAGELLQDRELYDDLKELLRDIKRHPWKLLWKD